MRKLNLGKYDADADSVYLFSYSFFDDQNLFLNQEFLGDYHPQFLNREEMVKKHFLTIDIFYYYLPKMAEYLNQKNNTNYSLHFWHPFLGYWMSFVIELALDKQFKIEKFLKNTNQSYSFNGINITNDGIFNNDIAFNIAGYCSIDLNLYCSTLIIDSLSSPTIRSQKEDFTLTISPEEVHEGPMAIKGNVEFIAGFNKFQSSIISSFIKVFSKKAPINVPTHILTHNESEICFIDWMDLFKKCLPTSYLDLKRFNVADIKPRNAPTIFTNYKSPIEKKMMACFLREQGNRIYISQHGSCFGELLTSTRNYLCEYAIDGFISWGWTEHNHHPANIISAPSPILSKLKLKKMFNFKKSKRIILTSSVYAPNDSLNSNESADFYIEYLENVIGFLETLSPALRKNFWFRPRLTHNEVTFNQAFVEHIKRKVPWVNILMGSLDREMLSAHIIIHDNCGSAFQKSLAINVPTLFFWRKDSIQFKDEIHEIFQELQQNSIYFESGGACAEFINKNYDSIESWWNGPKIFQLRKKLENSLYQTSFFPLIKWLKLGLRL